MTRSPPLAGLLAGLLLPACKTQEVVADTCPLDRPDPGTLRVDGTRIVDSHDRLVLLRGINAGGRSKFSPYMPFDFAEAGADAAGFDDALATYLDRAEHWGLNVLRVPFSWAAVEPEPGVDDPAWAARYDALLDEAWARGLWTIVDFHQDVYCEAWCGDGFPLWTLPGFDPLDPPETSHDCPDWFFGYLGDDDVDAAFDRFWADAPTDNGEGLQTQWRAMWSRMAARHADRPGVIGFELINEPHRGTADEEAWASGPLPAFYSEVAADVQAIDPDALVFFDSTGLDAVRATTSLTRPVGDNLVFAPHFYDPSIFLGGEADPAFIAEGLASWASVRDAWDMPLIIGEFGIQHERTGADRTTRAHYEALDAHQLHATWWEYSESAEDWNQEGLSVVGPAGEERLEILSELVRPYPHAIAGTDASWRFDPDSGIFEATWTAADGVSELVLPAWRTGDITPTIEIEGGCWDLHEQRILVSASPGAHVTVRVVI